MSDFSLLWHDYETWGANPRLDRPLQFAAIRTDYNLNIIDDPIELYATPPMDMLPNPEACLVTGLSPQDILEKNHLNELEFIYKINRHMLEPGTCTLGYNNIRFDDEITRFSLYRNLLDPYEREWKNGNSRWDIIDPLRLARALRPAGINWPTNADSRPSMHLSDLTHANNIEHEGAHDALADVYATLGLAKLLKTSQPKLYEFAFNNRSKHYVSQELNLLEPKMLIHISGMYPSDRGNLAIVYPVARHPSNQNGIVVFDLAFAPDHLKNDDIEFLHDLLFTKVEDLPEDLERLPLKTVHINRCPVLAPLGTLTNDTISRFGIDLKLCEDNLAKLKAIDELELKIQQILNLQQFAPQDPDLALYDGFFNEHDKSQMRQIHRQQDAIDLDKYDFKDSRLSELSFRFKARNFPHTLSKSETRRWHDFIKDRLNAEESIVLGINEYKEEIIRLRQSTQNSTDFEILAKLDEWVDTISIH